MAGLEANNAWFKNTFVPATQRVTWSVWQRSVHAGDSTGVAAVAFAAPDGCSSSAVVSVYSIITNGSNAIVSGRRTAQRAKHGQNCATRSLQSLTAE